MFSNGGAKELKLRPRLWSTFRVEISHQRWSSFLVGLPRGKQGPRGSISIPTISLLHTLSFFLLVDPFSTFFPLFPFFLFTFVAKSKERISSNLGGRREKRRDARTSYLHEKKESKARVDWKEGEEGLVYASS